MYAIVRSGGRQHKVAVGDILEIDKIEANAGDSVSLTPLLLVDGDKVTTDAKKLDKASVTAEVIAETKGPKIKIIKFKKVAKVDPNTDRTIYNVRQHRYCCVSRISSSTL